MHFWFAVLFFSECLTRLEINAATIVLFKTKIKLDKKHNFTYNWQVDAQRSVIKVNRQQPTSVMRRPQFNTHSGKIAHVSINMCDNQNL